MNLAEVIDGLVEERGLNREAITEIVCEGIASAYQKKYPDVSFVISMNKKTGELEILVEKEVVATVDDKEMQISLRKAKSINSKAKIGDRIAIPFEGQIGRIEIIAARQTIANKIRGLEQLAVYNEFIDKKGTIVSGLIHKKERSGWAIKIGDVMALLPQENSVETDQFKVGYQVKILLKDVLAIARGDYQLILDRASSEFVQKLIELEIPEVFEGVVEIKKIVRVAGYKTKAIVDSRSKEIDPVGTCVGVGGARIKPILRELGKEKIDLIENTDSLESLVKNSLKPAVIDNVEIDENSNKAVVWLAQDQRSLAIGRMGQNISLASKLTGVEIQLQDITSSTENAILTPEELYEKAGFEERVDESSKKDESLENDEHES
ncbi:MAG: transcription termination factor NusA [bacterium]